MEAATLAAVNELNRQNNAAMLDLIKEMIKEVRGDSSENKKMKQEEKLGGELASAIQEFSGSGFTDWKLKTESAARSKHKGFYQFLRWAENVSVQGPIDYDLSDVVESDGYYPEFLRVGHYWYDAFVAKLKGEAFDIVKNVSDQNGAEVWRRLCRRFQGKTIGKKLYQTRKVVNPGKVKKLSEATAAVENGKETWPD